jgi:hypothetical protein
MRAIARQLRHLALALALIALAASPTRAQQRSTAPPRAPTDVAADFLRAVRDQRWHDAARLLDLDALEYYRREQLALARLPHERRTMTVEDTCGSTRGCRARSPSISCA